MSNLYRYQSDPALYINLETPDTELLRERQKALQEKMAKLILDLDVITDAVVARNGETDE